MGLPWNQTSSRRKEWSELAFDAALAIRVGSASLFVLLGVAMAVIGRKSPPVVIIASFLGLYGVQIIVNNLARSYEWDSFLLRGSMAMALAALGIWAAFALSGLVTSQAKWAGWYGLAAGVVTTTLALQGDSGGLDSLFGFDRASANLRPFLHIAAFIGVGAATMFAASASATAAASASVGELRRALALAASVGVWTVFQAPSFGLQPWGGWSLAATISFVVAMTVPWLLASRRTGTRFALVVAMLWPACGALVYVYLAVANGDAANIYDPWGVIGVARLVGWTVLLYGILRWDLLRVALPHVVVRRGAVAGTALAVLFIVAQVAQNFFSAEYGLLTGGIMAGAFVFAASPIQRTFERMSSREPPARTGVPTRNATAKAGKQQEEAFRGAVRLAWKDRRFEQGEELALAVLADSMGLAAARATAIRHEVEREKGAA